MKIKHRWRDLTLKYKLVIKLYLMILPFLFVIGILFYSSMLENFRAQLTEGYSGVANQIYSSVSFLQTDIEDVSTYLCINNTINNILNSETPQTDAYAAGFADNSMRFIMDIIATKSYINAIGIYSNNGQIPYFITTDTSVFRQELLAVMQTDLYRNAFLAKGAPVWHNMAKDDTSLFTRSISDKLILARVIFNYVTVRPIGYLVIGINTQYVADMCKKSLRAPEDGIVVVYKNDVLITEGTVPQGFTDSVLQHKDDKTMQVNNASVILGHTEQDDLRVYYLLSNSAMQEKQVSLLVITLVITIGVLFLLLPISSLAVRGIVKPIRELLDSMHKFKKGDFNQRVDRDAKDEMGELAQHYNSMVQNIKELIETNYTSKIREHKSELMALQAQINPHFLYNTLDAIFWKAQEDGSKSAAKMIYALSRIFRLSLNRGQGLTTLKCEAELLEHYLEIQTERFSGKLHVTLDITPQAAECKLPKLILQPFVENAIIHGIEGSEQGGDVTVKAWCESEKLFISISDTGKGMSEKQIQELLEKLDNGDNRDNSSLGGYAIYNVNERLKLIYGDAFTLKIDSIQGTGTKVDITIPCGNDG
jgi:two-component system, sensor histidine kinase YesM